MSATQSSQILPRDSTPAGSPRIRLRDGRFLAYREDGVPKNKSKYRIIVVHGFGSSKDTNFRAPLELINDLGIYFLYYDRAGYGESDPNPTRSVKNEALDIQELADQLEIGPKFYLIAVSMGSYPTWGCLKYIPDRLAGVSFVVPVVNYRWPSIPSKLVRMDFRKKIIDFGLFLAKYTPELLYWLVTQKWLPTNSTMQKNPMFFNSRDLEALKTTRGFPMLTRDRLLQKGVFNTLRNDFSVAFRKWEFDPFTDIKNPFAENQNRVHIWQGFEDKVVPVELQRYVSSQMPWIRYHEVPDGGHVIIHYSGMCEAILRSLLLGEDPLSAKQS